MIIEHDELHDEKGDLCCPTEGCDAAGDRIELVGHEYNYMPLGDNPLDFAGETFCFECDRGHRWDLEPWADDSNLYRVTVFFDEEG
jgi:hypothetical protein